MNISVFTVQNGNPVQFSLQTIAISTIVTNERREKWRQKYRFGHAPDLPVNNAQIKLIKFCKK